MPHNRAEGDSGERECKKGREAQKESITINNMVEEDDMQQTYTNNSHMYNLYIQYLYIIIHNYNSIISGPLGNEARTSGWTNLVGSSSVLSPRKHISALTES